jgi:hypothetical protein
MDKMIEEQNQLRKKNQLAFEQLRNENEEL